METVYKKVNTEVGYIEARRDAIHLDSFQQQNNSLILVGEVYAKWCEKNSAEHKWYKYRLSIKGVKNYRAINIEDYYREGICTESSFSEVNDDLNGLCTIIFETYDWAYIIVCKSHKFEVIDCR